MDGSEPIKVAGIEVPAEERTPLVDHLLRVIEEQQAENRAIARRDRQAEGTAAAADDPAEHVECAAPRSIAQRSGAGKRPGSAKRQKTGELMIHETIPVPLEGLPEGTRQNGYEDFVVQDLKIEAHNVCYRRLRYLLPDGTSRTAPLPAHVQGHFGPGLRSYVLYQHHQNGVTQPLIHEELLDLGIDISTGQIDRLLTEGHEPVPRGEGRPAAGGAGGVELFSGRRHGGPALGKKRLHHGDRQPAVRLVHHHGEQEPGELPEAAAAPHEEYVWGEDALMYAESQGLSLELRARLASAAWKGDRIISSDKAWERQLAAWRIRGDEPRRIVTEAALFGTLMHYELYVGQPLVSDDAGQFKISGLLHALCWLHAERSIRKLVP